MGRVCGLTVQCSLIKNNDEDSSLDLDISEIDF